MKKQKPRYLNRRWAFISLLFIGISFLVIGKINGEASVVLTKAIRICLECIGIG